jgi:tetratricopeptide (TPR) repeat protein
MMISQAHSRMGDWSSAEQLARECVRMAEQMGHTRLLADALTRLGITLLETHPRDAIALYDRALAIFARGDDRFGQVRCHINTGIAYERLGKPTSAAHCYQLALELGRSAHAPDLAGIASANLGVLYLKSGSHDQAHDRLEEALRLFTTVRNEPHRLATLYNKAHLARERGDARRAIELYQEIAGLAGTTGQLDVEIGALAGRGLAALALGKRDIAGFVLQQIATRMDAKGDWWFQGRELAEALIVRVALAKGEPAEAERLFQKSLALVERNDRYAAAWLVAECARPLAAAGVPAAPQVVDGYARHAAALGYAALSARLAAVQVACPQG